MRTLVTAASLLALTCAAARGEEVMSDAYWKLWNPDVQARIDRDIEQHRRADAVLKLNLPAGTVVEVEQVSHEFIFGANIFNFNQLGEPELNRKYKELYGSLFNSASIAFYWKKFEPEPGKLRFAAGPQDTEEFWNTVADPKSQPHWRRPATDPVVEFCESQGIRLHGHPMIWGNRRWHHPEWMFEQFCPPEEKAKIQQQVQAGLDKVSPGELAALAPVYTQAMRELFQQRIVELAEHYQGRIDSWDVVNESSVDFQGDSQTGDAVCKSAYGLMPGDYVYHAFKTADARLPAPVLRNINDYANNANYANQAKDLLAKGCRIDVLGSQMHLFQPQQCLDIAAGKPIESPEIVWKRMETLARAGLPIHISEITITAPGDDARGREIQATVARNLYRLWFSIQPIMGITWWNVVDDCGAPGEPTTSGLFTRDMQPKLSYHALDKLINHEWKTRLTLAADATGQIAFRGFKGRYRIRWKDPAGAAQSKEFKLTKDGVGQ